MQRARSLWGMAVLLALGAYLIQVPLQDTVAKQRPDIYHVNTTTASSGAFTGISGPTPVLIAALGGFRTVAADLLWLKVDQLWDGGSWYLLPSVMESVVQLDPQFVLAWQIYGWHLAYNLNAESELMADRRYWLAEGEKVLERGVAENPKNWEMRFEYAWTLYDRAHDLYPAAEEFYRVSEMPGAKPYVFRLYYRPYEHLLDFKKLWPALDYAKNHFPEDHAHQKIVTDSIKWWKEHWNDPEWHRHEIVRENTARKQRALKYELYENNPYWEVCPVCGLPSKKGEPICTVCGQYSFKDHRVIAPNRLQGAI